MSQEANQIKGILAYITTDKSRYLGGNPLSILAKDENELIAISEAIARAFLAEILKLSTGDVMVIKK